jgi:hypothetical protein
MALRYLLDEHLRGELWRAIGTYNAQAADPLDVIRVGDPADLPLSSSDPDILVWAEKAARVVVSRDTRTMIGELLAHLAAGRGSPGLFIIRRRAALADVLSFLVEAANAGDDDQWRDQAVFIP